MVDYRGTLHVGNMCNNNYKLFKALRKLGVDAHFVFFERMVKYRPNPFSDPRYYDREFDLAAPYIHPVTVRSNNHQVQKTYELALIAALARRFGGKHWIHAQTEYPLYVSLFSGEYSGHSTGSDLRAEYFKRPFKCRLLKRAYRKAKMAFFNNVDLFDHELRHYTQYRFLPNPVDLGRYRPLGPQKASDRRLRILLPSRITYFNPQDPKGNRIFLGALKKLGSKPFPCDIILSADDPAAPGFAELCCKAAPQIHCELASFSGDRRVYLRELEMADLVIDQFALGAMGGIALDCFASRRVCLVHLASDAYKACYQEEFPLPNLGNEQALADELRRCCEPRYRIELAEDLHQWLKENHEEKKVAKRFLQQLETATVAITR